ncbi:MAG: F0F1 ATP synthase subunit delta [Ruminococcus sp.]|nr:F0F1 ATP synthase subunit delta [Ruminococcus sp.]
MTGSFEKNYATALFELCIENDCLESVYEEFLCVTQIFEQNPDFVKLLKLPTVEWKDKEALLSDAFEGKLSEIMFNFLNVMAKKGRAGDATAIFAEFKALYNEKMNILDVTATTAIPLSETLREKLIDKLTAVSNKKIVLKECVDKNIIGGIVLSYNNTEIHASVRDKLDKLKAQINSVVV